MKKLNKQFNFSKIINFLKKQDKFKLLSIFMLLFSILFSFLLYSPLLNEGRNNGGDNFYHTTNMIYLKELVEQEHTVFGWFHIFGTGQPLLNLYQSLYYLIAITLHYLTFKALSIIFLDKFVLVLFTSLYPLSIYYFLRKLKFNYLICGLGSMLSMISNAGWGNNITLYTYSGAITASVSMFFVPLALGSLYSSLKKGSSIILPVFLLLFTVLGHFLIGYETIFFIIIEIILIYLCYGLSSSQIKKTTMFFVLFLLLISFILIPSFTLNEVRLFSEQRKEGAYGQAWASFSAQTFINSYIGGELLDRTGKNVKMYKWFDNSNFNRYPILTIFSILGFIASFFLIKKFRYLFLNIGFQVSILFFIGIDDVFLLKFLPLIKDFGAIRGSIFVEFFVICLSAIGIYMLIQLIKKSYIFVNKKSIKFFHKKGRIIQTILFFLTIFVILLIFINPYKERYEVAKILVDTVDNPRWKELEKIFSPLENNYRGGRIFIGDQSGVTNEPTKVVAAGIVKKPVITNPSWEQYLAILTIPKLNSQLPYNKKFREFLNIRYILFSNKEVKSKNFNQTKKDMEEISSSKSFLLYEAKTNSSYIGVTKLKPIWAFVSDSEWYHLSFSWMENFKDRWEDNETAYFMRSENSLLDNIEFDANKYPTILLSSYKVKDRDKVISKLIKYVDEGGNIISKEPIPVKHQLVSRDSLKTNIDVATKRFDGGYNLNETYRSLSKFFYDYSSDKPRFLVFKMSYFPGWNLLIDGKKVDYQWVTPGFLGFWVPEGKHNIKVYYSGPIIQKISAVISLITFISILIFIFYRYKFKIGKTHDNKKFVLNSFLRKLIPYVISFLLLGYILSLYYDQNYLMVPSKISPTILERYNPNNVHLIWNRFANVPETYNVHYNVQIII